MGLIGAAAYYSPISLEESVSIVASNKKLFKPWRVVDWTTLVGVDTSPVKKAVKGAKAPFKAASMISNGMILLDKEVSLVDKTYRALQACRKGVSLFLWSCQAVSRQLEAPSCLSLETCLTLEKTNIAVKIFLRTWSLVDKIIDLFLLWLDEEESKTAWEKQCFFEKMITSSLGILRSLVKLGISCLTGLALFCSFAISPFFTLTLYSISFAIQFMEQFFERNDEQRQSPMEVLDGSHFRTI
jgi:hypothetical protein